MVFRRQIKVVWLFNTGKRLLSIHKFELTNLTASARFFAVIACGKIKTTMTIPTPVGVRTINLPVLRLLIIQLRQTPGRNLSHIDKLLAAYDRFPRGHREQKYLMVWHPLYEQQDYLYRNRSKTVEHRICKHSPTACPPRR